MRKPVLLLCASLMAVILSCSGDGDSPQVSGDTVLDSISIVGRWQSEYVQYMASENPERWTEKSSLTELKLTLYLGGGCIFVNTYGTWKLTGNVLDICVTHKDGEQVAYSLTVTEFSKSQMVFKMKDPPPATSDMWKRYYMRRL
mgnify:CR=1 FL=1